MRSLRGDSRSLSIEEEMDTVMHSSEEDEEEEEQTSRSLKIFRHAFLAALAIAGVLACAIAVLAPETPFAPSKTFGAETVGLFETEEFHSLMTSHVRGLMESYGVQDDHTQEHVAAATAKATEYIGKHISDSDAHSLKNARLGVEGWDTLSSLLVAMSDKRVQGVGHAIVEEARANLFAGPAEIGKHVVARLQREHTLGLAQELMPPKLQSVLVQRWSSVNATEDDIWKMMIDPTGGTLAHIRKSTSAEIESKQPLILSSVDGEALSEPVRSLRKGPWASTKKHPTKLNAAELATGITSVVLTSAALILLHLDLFLPRFNVPHWVHWMLLGEWMALGIADCAVAKSFWCEFEVAALGVTGVDGILLFSGMRLGGNKNKAEEFKYFPQPVPAGSPTAFPVV